MRVGIPCESKSTASSTRATAKAAAATLVSSAGPAGGAGGDGLGPPRPRASPAAAGARGLRGPSPRRPRRTAPGRGGALYERGRSEARCPGSPDLPAQVRRTRRRSAVRGRRVGRRLPRRATRPHPPFLRTCRRAAHRRMRCLDGCTRPPSLQHVPSMRPPSSPTRQPGSGLFGTGWAPRGCNDIHPNGGPPC